MDVLRIIESIVALKVRNGVVPPCADEMEVLRSSGESVEHVRVEISRLESEGLIVIKNSINRRTLYANGSEKWNDADLKRVEARRIAKRRRFQNDTID